jgi:uncharacterized protein YjiS (DUF1127 family)
MLDTCTHWTRSLHVDLMSGHAASAVVPPSSTPTRSPRVADGADAIDGLFARLVRTLRRAWAAHAKRRRARRLQAELAGLDARELHDLGLDRAEIESVVAEIVSDAAPTRRQAAGTFGLYSSGCPLDEEASCARFRSARAVRSPWWSRRSISPIASRTRCCRPSSPRR